LLFPQTFLGVFFYRKAETTDCAPNNGYYFLPVSSEDRGQFVLKVNTLLKVEPADFEVNIDGETDSCSKNVDMNFKFIGFGIAGSVLSKGSNKGPQGIKVELSKNDGAGQVVASASTDDDGKYDFFGVTPGPYTVKIAKEYVDQLAFDAVTRKVDVGEDVGNCAAFNILGYSIAGQVANAEDQPLKGVTFDLIGLTDDGVAKRGSKPVATTTSKADGSIRFPGIPVGLYKVILSPSHGQKLKLAKNEMNVEVSHENAKLETFIVESFTTSGKVVAGSTALKGVKITAEFNGKQQDLISGADGSFTLAGVSKGPLTLKATLEGYEFDTKVINKVDPDAQLPAWSPARFRLAGKVDRSGFEQEIRVRFNNEKTDETVGKVIVTENGQFSIYLPQGDYSVSVDVSAEQKQASIGFAPLEHKVKVVDKPLANLNFHAIKADIEGHIQCLASNCGTGLEVTLSLEGFNPQRQPISPDGKFKFTGVLPATYTLAVSEDGRCWERPVQQISVSKDVKDIVFKQIGKYITVDSTRSTLLIIQGIKSKQTQETVIVDGHNVICVKGQDTDVTLTTKGCEEFEINPDQLDLKEVSNGGLHVDLRPTKYSVTGRISSKSKIADLKLVAKSEARQVEIETKLEAGGTDYSFSLMAFPGEEVLFQPVSSEHLFDPESLHVFVDHDCHLEAVLFNAKAGHFVKGQITPAVEGVEIKIINAKEASINKHTSTLTDSKGQYKLGPLPQADYKVEAAKEGYVFEAASDGFRSRKLASILVRVKDHDGNDLTGVVLSVSGGDYRSNTKSKDGMAEFLSLAPAEYFVKPQLKEYEFEPKHKLMVLNEGQNAEVILSAKRVAFSIFGKVVSLNGQPEPGIILKATSKACDSTEDANSEADGLFRFRGLKPKCEYTITLLKGDSIEKLIPNEVKVKMTETDHTLGKAIVAMRAFETMDIMLKVVEEPKASSNIKVTLTSAEGGSFSYTTKAVSGHIVPLPKLAKDNKKYNIHVETVPDKYAPQKKVFQTIIADDYFKSVKLVLNKTATAQKPTRKASAFFYILPLIVIAVATFFLWEQRPAFVKKLLDSTTGGGSSSQNQSSAASEATGKDSNELGDTDTPTTRKRRKR
jgi:hypothetical protein